SRKTLYPCRLNSDVFDGAELVVDDNEVAYFKRLVEEYDEVVEQVSQNVLCSECNGYTADTKSCDDGRNIVAQVAEEKDEAKSPYDNGQYQNNALHLLHFFRAVFLAPHVIFQEIAKRGRHESDQEEGYDGGDGHFEDAMHPRGKLQRIHRPVEYEEV